MRDVSAHLLKFYLDGVLVSSITDPTTGTFTRADSFANQPDRIGAVAVPCAGKRFYRGLIDEVQIYNRALSDSEIQALSLTVLEASIDIKPGSFPNSINLSSAGVVPVAILSSATFDATQVDPATVSLAGAAVKLIGKGNRYSCSAEDVNGDGRLDVVCHVVTAQFMIEPGGSVAVLAAKTFSGQAIRGEDSINIVP
jgi:hypothetical protein